MVWQVNAKVKGQDVLLTLETDDDCTREEARVEFYHSIPMAAGKPVMPEKVDWRTLKKERQSS